MIDTKESWVPWVWNIPTRDIYPRLYYDHRCSPPVTHYYKPRRVIIKPRHNKEIIEPGYLLNDPYVPEGIYSRYVYLDYPDPRNPYVCPL